tara:strand:- start:161 stop:1132 length:972 start_codon:yes stop_codon:yes gene_type:complete
MNIAIVGCTGLVGKEIKKILESKKIKNVLFIASKKSVGKTLKYNNKKHVIISIKEALKSKIDYAIFSAGSDVSKKYAEKFTKKGTVVIDNSSYYRMKKNIKLIVPEINGKDLNKEDKIIANPNCSTTQLVLTLHPINKIYPIKRIVVSTYQAITGTGKDAVDQLIQEEKGKTPTKKIYKDGIFRNVIPKCDIFLDNLYTKEEEKIIKETNKILNTNIKITATAVRTPTIGGHAESVNIEFKKEISISKIIEELKKQKGIIVLENKNYITPNQTREKDEVFVSRIRKDHSVKNGINLWIVADPLRKGAATNTVQILETLINLNN